MTSHQIQTMQLITVEDYQTQLRDAKKTYDKLNKQYKKTRSEYLLEDIEDLRQDIVELQILINEAKQGKPLHLCDTSKFVY